MPVQVSKGHHHPHGTASNNQEVIRIATLALHQEREATALLVTGEDITQVEDTATDQEATLPHPLAKEATFRGNKTLIYLRVAGKSTSLVTTCHSRYLQTPST